MTTHNSKNGHFRCQTTQADASGVRQKRVLNNVPVHVGGVMAVVNFEAYGHPRVVRCLDAAYRACFLGFQTGARWAGSRRHASVLALDASACRHLDRRTVIGCRADQLVGELLSDRL